LSPRWRPRVIWRPAAPAGRICTFRAFLLDDIEKGDLDAVKRYLAGGADINAELKDTQDNKRTQDDKDDRTPIHGAAVSGHTEIVRMLVERGADVNTRTTTNGATPLYLACAYKDVDRVRFLLDHGADANASDKDGGTPLHQVIAQADERSRAIADLLLKHGSAPDIFAHAQLGRTEKVLALLDEEPDLVHAKGPGGQTLLHIAAANGNLDLVKALVMRGADLEAKNSWAGWTPLHSAACEGRADVVKHLIEHGAKVEVPGEYSQGILYTASMQGHTEVVRLLIAAGADINATTVWGYFPLATAAQEGRIEVVKLLLDAGADVNRSVKNGGAVLDAALDRGQDVDGILEISRLGVVPRLNQRPHQEVNVFLGVLRRKAHAQAARAGRHGGRPDRRAEYAARKKRGGHREGPRRLADDDRDDRRRAAAAVEIALAQRAAQPVRQRKEALLPLRLGLKDRQGRPRGLARRRRQRGRVNERPGAVHEQLDHVARRRDEPAHAAQRLRERADAGRDRAGEARAGGAENAEGVGLVHDEHRPCRAADSGQFAQGGHVAAHRENRIADEQAP
jgi:ankyrin repeat protein